MIPDAAVEAAAKAMRRREIWPQRAETEQMLRNYYARAARIALEAAAPHMLSHEREETRLAHLDAVVNARTVDKLNTAIEKVLLACDAMDMGTRIQSGNPKTTSFAANAIRRSIADALSK